MTLAPNSTLAAVFHAPDQPLELLRLETPEPQGAEMLVRVLGCTLCGSDLHTVDGRRQVATPTILGHEIVGQIAALGDAAPRQDLAGQQLGQGDRVVWSIVASCGDCFYCRRGLPQKCASAVKYGHEPLRDRRALTGGLAEHCLLAPGTAIVRLPDDLPLEVACPASCATATIAAAIEASGEINGRTFCILGAGLLGLTAAVMARSLNAAAVIVVETQPQRREMAMSFGATHAIAPEQLAATAKETTSGYGVDAVLELTGSATACDAAMPLVRLGGTVVLVGAVYPGPPLAVTMEQIVRRNLTLRGIHNYAPRHLLSAVQFLAAQQARFPFAKLVAQWLPLTEIQQALSAAKNPGTIRVGIRPQQQEGWNRG